MKKTRHLLILLGLFQAVNLFAQTRFVKDTLESNGDSVVVTATRTERKLNNLTVPVLAITNNYIRLDVF